MAEYAYNPLKISDSVRPWNLSSLRSVRLLLILPGLDSTPLNCILCTATLPENYNRPGPFYKKDKEKEEQSSLEYEALSYTWGTVSKTRSIFVKSGVPVEHTDELFASVDDATEKVPENDDWRSLSITESLYTALQHLRQTDKPRLMWIDAVCIDQDNEKEKTQQVRIMDRIYTQAAQVIVWLGESSPPVSQPRSKSFSSSVIATDTPSDEDDSDFAIRSLKRIAGGKWMDQTQRRLARAALERLLKRPWWTRAWVVQEVLMARKCTFVCGFSSISWEDVGRGIHLLEPFPSEGVTEWSTRGSEFWTPRLWQMKSNLGMSTIMQLPYLLGHFATRECSDPRDKIFSLVSLVAAGPNIREDYSLSTRDVYSEVVRRCVLHKPNLSIITRHHSGFDPSGPNPLDLPSWVPDFSLTEGDGSLSWTMATDWYYRDLYYADGRFNTEAIMEFPFLDPFKFGAGVMLGQGACLDRIVSVTEPIPGEAYDADPDGTDPETWLKHLRKWEPDSVFGDEKYAQTGESGMRAYWRTLVMDKHDLKWRYSHLDEKFTQMWRRDFCYLACSRRVSFSYAEEQDKLLESFVSMLRRTTRGRCFAVTENGYLALVPQYAAAGDLIAVLLGGSAPFVLREERPPSGEGDEEDMGSYRMIGTSYVHGWMDGELIEELRAEEVDGAYFPIS